MTTNQLFVRDFTLVAVGVAAVIAVALALAPRTTRDTRHVVADPVTHGSPAVALGAHLYLQKACVQCHTVDGTPRIGPSFLHAWGSTVTLADGRTVTVGAAYIRESLLVPTAKTRRGFPPGTMPSYEGILKEREVSALTAYLESLK